MGENNSEQTDKGEKVEALKTALANHLDIKPEAITGFTLMVEHTDEEVKLSLVWSGGNFWRYAASLVKMTWQQFTGAEL